MAQQSLTIGEWRVEPRRNRLSRGTRIAQLEPQMMEVLLCLAERPGEAQSRDEILNQAWQGRLVSDESLSVAIHGLRKALGDPARTPRYIETIPRFGYRLIAEVTTGEGGEPIPPSPAAEPAATSPEWPGDPGAEPGRQMYIPTAWGNSAVPAVVAAMTCLVAVVAFLGSAMHRRADGREGGVPPASMVQPVLDDSRLGRPLSEAARKEFELGYFHIMRLTPTAVKKAREHFRRCLELDPGYAPAWAGLSAALLRPASTDTGKGVAERLSRARQAAERAVALQPDLPAAQVAMARVHLYIDWHPKAAEDCLRRALELDPGDSHGHQLNAVVQLTLGRPGLAETAARRAVELDPAAPARYVDLAGLLMLTGNVEASALELKKALELDPRLTEAKLLLPFVHLLAGRHEEFVEEFRSTWDQQQLDPVTREALEAGHAADGVPGLLRALLNSQGPTMPATERAKLRVLAGEPESALENLRSCLTMRCTPLLWLDSDPIWDPLVEHPEFQELAQQIREIRKS